MCGICGLFEYRTGQEVDRNQLDRMNSTLRHRGPDDQGSYVSRGVGLAMCRLSVIDLAGGHQPITNERNDCWIVSNGEIYNYRALANVLLERGHRLRTHSDTEVILHLYEEYGTDCVNHLDGMFAFAIYDRRRDVTSNKEGCDPPGRLFLARDRLGKKPLYYADVGGRLVFGSEMKAVLCDPNVSKELDPEALRLYLSLLVVPAPFGILKAIRKLQPGHFLTCEPGVGVRVQRYWDYRTFVGSSPIPVEEAVTEIRRLLFAAVEKRLIADVPLGAFLSGGLDSSTVVAIMSTLTSAPVKTFAIGFAGPEYFNELPYAAALANYYRTDHSTLTAQPNILELLPELAYYSDEPFAIASAIPLYLLSKAAREDVTVVLTGDGGDEVFGGYRSYLYETWADRYRHLPHAADRLIVGTGAVLDWRRSPHRGGKMSARIDRFVKNARKSVAERKIDLRAAFAPSELQALSLLGCADAPRENGGATAFFEGLLEHLGHLPPEVQLNILDFLILLPDEMLCKVDRMTMAASLEARCPLLDWKLVEYLAALPWRLKIPGGRRSNVKYLLRRAVADLLPQKLLKRPKHTFDVPLDYWFRGQARAFLHDVLRSDRIRRQGVFREGAVADLLARYDAGDASATNRIYALLVFQLWAEAML